MSILFVLQFLLAYEIFATSLFFGAVAIAVAMYLFLALAVITALWLSAASFSPSEKLAVAVVTIVFMLPNQLLDIGIYAACIFCQWGLHPTPCAL